MHTGVLEVEPALPGFKMHMLMVLESSDKVCIIEYGVVVFICSAMKDLKI